MNEKVAINDVLATTNAIITMLNYTIQQSNNKNFRDIAINYRDEFEGLQWQIYLICKQNGYYIPAAPAGNADILQVKKEVSK